MSNFFCLYLVHCMHYLWFMLQLLCQTFLEKVSEADVLTWTYNICTLNLKSFMLFGLAVLVVVMMADSIHWVIL